MRELRRQVRTHDVHRLGGVFLERSRSPASDADPRTATAARSSRRSRDLARDAAPARRLRLRRHARADRRRSRDGAPAPRVGRGAARPGRAAAHHVAVISGRSLRDLAALSRLPDEIHLVGSHGTRVRRRLRVRPRARGAGAARPRHRASCTRSPRRGRASRVELKPAGVALHYRAGAPARTAARVLAAVRGPGALAGRPRARGQDGRRARRRRRPTRATRSTRSATRSAPRAASSSATTSPTRTPSPPDRPRPRHQGRRRRRRRAEHRVDGPGRRRRRARAPRRERGASGSPAPAPCRSSATRCSPTAAPSPWSRPTRASPGCATRAPTRRRLRRAARRPTGRLLRRAPAHEGAPTGQRYLAGTLTLETRWPGLTSSTTSTAATPTDACASCGCSTGIAPDASSSSRPRPDFGRVADRAARRARRRSRCSAPPTRSRCYAPGLTGRSSTRHPARPPARRRSAGGGPYVLELRCGTDSLAAAPDARARAPRRIETHVAALARAACACPRSARADWSRAAR